MIDGKFDYFAFISYRWEDEKMAKWLQEKLEHYKLPTSLREQNPNLPTHIRPIFRDKTDLNGHTLEESLMSALELSRYLIVICSPLATQSEWVNRGIQKFIDFGREKDIIPFIVDGEANADDPKNECFPPALRSLKGERAIYGININDNGRDAAAVKVVSRMFDVKYDTLWNRFLLEQKKRRRYTITGLVAAILVVAGVAGYIWMQSQKIERQYKELQAKNVQIEQQNKDLDAKSDSIQVANDSIKRAYERLDLSEKNLAKSNADLKQSNIRLGEERDNVLKANWEMMENQALAVAEKAKQKIADGEVYDAMLALLEVLPEYKSSKDKAYVPEAESALRIALDSIRGTSWKKRALVENAEYFFSANDEYLLSIQHKDSVTAILNVTNSGTLQDMCNIQLPINFSYISCSDNGEFICVGTNSEIMVYDSKNGKFVSRGGFNNSMIHKVIQNFFPVYVKTSLFLPNEEDYIPNILTSYFKPENTTSNIEVIDYSPLQKWILYKKLEQIHPEEQDFFIESYKLYDLSKRTILWEVSDSTIIPTNFNDVSLSHNGNFVVVTHYGSLDVFDINNKTCRTINTGEFSDHYSNHSVITKDEKYIFQHCDFTNAHIYDIQTCICLDSIGNFPLLPYSPSFTQNGATFVINFYDGVENISKPFLFTKTTDMHLTQPIDIKSSIIRKNINNHVTNRLNIDNSYVLYYDDNRNIKWECMNAKFIGYTPDMEYVAVVKNGMRGYSECQILEKNSGICMYSESPEYLQDESFRFLSYRDLLNTCKQIVRNLKMAESTRKSYYL